MFQEIKDVPEVMRKAAEALNEGPVLVVYRDYTAIRMETERGRDPYVWRNGCWRRMRPPLRRRMRPPLRRLMQMR